MKNLTVLAISPVLLIASCTQPATQTPSDDKAAETSTSAGDKGQVKSTPTVNQRANATKTISSSKMCGWLIAGPMADWYLRDKNAEWALEYPAAEGTTTTSPAIGIDLVYNFKDHSKDSKISDSNWISTSEGMDYTCACLNAETDQSNKRVTKITKAEARPLSECTLDKSLPAPPQ